MRIILNKREELFESLENITISDLLVYKKYVFPNIIVKINGILVKKESYPATLIKNGDRVEMIHMVSGG